jgi:RecQ family ATP-dependent DNA helicase
MVLTADTTTNDGASTSAPYTEFEMETLEDPVLCVLQKVFNHQTFRDNQKDVIETLLQDKDVLAVIPTGGGKSLCYWIPGIISKGVTVVVTPLIALLNDQVSKLKNHNIPVCCITSSMSPKEREHVFHELSKVDTKYKFLYGTPEFVLSKQAKQCFEIMVKNNTLRRFIIDEAHCIDTWGNSFRPAYSNLSELKQFKKPLCAFTGTATHSTQEKIIEKLSLLAPVIFQASCNRANLFLKVMKKGEKHPKEEVVEYIIQHHSNQCGIVYCFSTKDTVELAYILKSKGLHAVYYHGQLDFFGKSENAKAWLKGKALIMCATSAFGMGIDKPDVRFVFHITLPRSIEDYFQEAGRAGRDGHPSSCIIGFRFGDRNQLMNTISAEKSKEEIEYLRNFINGVVLYCMSTACRRGLIMVHFGDKSNVVCGGTCDNCSNPTPPLKEYTSEALMVCKCLEELILVQPLVSIRQLALTFKGSKSKRDVESKGFHNIEHYGAGRTSFKNDADATTFIHHLLVRNILLESDRVVNSRRTTPFITVGPKLAELKNGYEQIWINL